MRDALSRCGALLLTAALLPIAIHAQTSAQTSTQPAAAVTAAEVQQLRDALAAQQKQIAEQQARIEALAKQLAAQQPHAPSLGNVASATPMVPAGTLSAEASLPASMGQSAEQKQPAAAPPATDSIVLKQGMIRLGAVAYGDWGIYPQTGWGPQFFTQVNPPGPGNDNYNSFDITRSYLNFLFIPNKHLTIRLTPNLYRDATTSGNLTIRLKYAYAELNNLFENSEYFKDDNIRLGMQMNPLVDWEEGLYGYRFVNLVPWNFLSLSSTHVGASLNGPIKFHGKQYLDWQIGAFNDANFHQVEASSRKQGMARLSFYPMGATSKYQGLGLTGFVDYGFSNTPVASESTKGFPLYRIAALAHYTTTNNGASIAFEYDYGRNSFGSGNLFSGTGKPTGADAPIGALATALLDNNGFRATKQQGFDVFGHVDIPKSKFSLFGMYEFFQPNTEVARDPFDFHRAVAGVAYRYNKNLRFAFDSQNILWSHSQFVFPAAQAAQFGPYTGGDVTNPVPKSIKGIFMNMELTF
jgi:uncharacterized coiled-coil protein SlyX